MLALSHVPNLRTRLSGIVPNISVTLLHVRHHTKSVLVSNGILFCDFSYKNPFEKK
ncbi:hypothetical protein SAMN02982990_03314 [Photorhabdus luminescens]|uniref:Uncharacterized protein n=1 Tax=Photorhabdus luminescens TaxID=29488 RepID=A0A1G5R6M1_PHOLU|nr:hypothetical protein SAMN02982990_03314 [Photorhabdus luminescens]